MHSSSYALIQALGYARRHFIGGYRSRGGMNKSTAFPNRQDLRPMARYIRQDIRRIAKSLIVVETHYSTETVWDQLVSDPAEYAKFRKASVPTLRAIRDRLLADARGES